MRCRPFETNTSGDDSSPWSEQKVTKESSTKAGILGERTRLTSTKKDSPPREAPESPEEIKWKESEGSSSSPVMAALTSGPQ